MSAIEDETLPRYHSKNGLLSQEGSKEAGDFKNIWFLCFSRMNGYSCDKPRRLVFIDETWTKTNMALLRGWSERGERLETAVPHGHVWTPPPMQEEL
ncbi:hypothetical protein LMIY3S_00272 [Labrys miyagiensis]